jgi:hypothetical protein
MNKDKEKVIWKLTKLTLTEALSNPEFSEAAQDFKSDYYDDTDAELSGREANRLKIFFLKNNKGQITYEEEGEISHMIHELDGPGTGWCYDENQEV